MITEISAAIQCESTGWQAARAGRAAGTAATTLHRSLSFDVSVHSLKMATSHISPVWKYFTIDVAYACVSV